MLFAEPGFASPIGIYIAPGPDDPTRYAVFAGQSGLGMPSRDYYLLPGAKYEAFRAAYRTYVTQIQTLAGIGDAALAPTGSSRSKQRSRRRIGRRRKAATSRRPTTR